MRLVVVSLVAALAASEIPSRADTPIQGEQALKRAIARFEEIAGPLDPAAYAPREPAAIENAAVPLVEAARITPRDRETRERLLTLSKGAPSRWSVAEVEAARRLVDAHGPVLALLDRASARSGSRFAIEYAEGTFANPPPLLGILDTARIAALDARLALVEDDPTRACLGAERIGAVARALEGESMLITYLVGLATERIQLELAAEIASAPGADEPLLNRIEAALLQNDVARQARRAVALDFAALAARIETTAPHGGLLADFLDHGSDLLEASAGSWAESRAAIDRVADAARRCTEVEAHDPAARRGITTAHEVLGTWTGPFSRAAATEAGRAVVRTAIEVRRRAIRDGTYPADLTDDPATATPLSLTGRPLRVGRLEDGTGRVEAEGADDVWLAQHGDATPAPPFRVTLPRFTPPAPPEPVAAP